VYLSEVYSIPATSICTSTLVVNVGVVVADCSPDAVLAHLHTTLSVERSPRKLDAVSSHVVLVTRLSHYANSGLRSICMVIIHLLW